MRDMPLTFARIRALATDLPPPDAEAHARARQREEALIKPAGALGRLETLVPWLASWQGRYPPRLDAVRIVIFAGNHGVAARGVSAYPTSVTTQMVRAFETGLAAINQLGRAAAAEIAVVPLALDRPTADMTQGPAMSEEECLEAMAAGMASVAPGTDLLALGEMGIGNTTAAAALALSLFGGAAKDWVGPGTGVSGARLTAKAEAVQEAVARNAPQDPLESLAALGGREIAALFGAILAARLARVPVLLDGYVVGAAAAVLHRLAPSALDHCQSAHVSAELGHRRLLTALGLAPLLDLQMRLGEGSGAALAIPLLRMALACHLGMASFEEAGVAGKND